MRRSRCGRPSAPCISARRWTCARPCFSRSTPTIRWSERKIATKACAPSTRSASRTSRASKRVIPKSGNRFRSDHAQTIGREPMAEFIEVREVGLRDGIQSIKTVVPTDMKIAWIKAEVAAGVRDIEVCSFVPPKLLPQFADAEEVTRQALQVPGLTVAALMPNLKGAERGAALGVHRLDYVVSVSEGHNLNNVRRSTADSLADLQRIADFLKTIETSKRPR